MPHLTPSFEEILLDRKGENSDSFSIFKMINKNSRTLKNVAYLKNRDTILKGSYFLYEILN